MNKGIDLRNLLSEDKARDQEEWEKYLISWETGICSECHSKGLRSKAEQWKKKDIDNYRHWMASIDPEIYRKSIP